MSTAGQRSSQSKLTISEVSASSTTPAATGSQQTATCPNGKTALGGGFSSSPSPVLSGSLSFPIFWASYRTSPKTWAASLTISGDVAETVTSYAYCASGLKVGETTGSATLPASGPNTSSATASTTTCGKGRALLGGGFTNTPATVASALPILTGSRAAGGVWQVGALNLTAAAGTLGSRGYCA